MAAHRINILRNRFALTAAALWLTLLSFSPQVAPATSVSIPVHSEAAHVHLRSARRAYRVWFGSFQRSDHASYCDVHLWLIKLLADNFRVVGYFRRSIPFIVSPVSATVSYTPRRTLDDGHPSQG
ncbi:MAG TPA: hypothetical protein VD816_00255 [Ohtaekwangia sp.]|nr:hypothetical protein [Ohtaekwangia sp.]